VSIHHDRYQESVKIEMVPVTEQKREQADFKRNEVSLFFLYGL